MSDQLAALQIKIQTQMLQTTFFKNMAFLKESMPAIYEYYASYTPQRAELAIDANGFVNLKSNGQFVYNDDPKKSSCEQVDTFFQNPPCFDFEIPIRTNKNYKYQHERVLNDIYIKKRSDLISETPYKLKAGDQINFIILMGSGLGYHVEELLSKCPARSMFIYEPEPDAFFATLHTVDITAWSECCKKLGGELTFKIGGNESEFVNEISHYFDREGYFNFPQMYLYRHYNSDKTNDAFRLINKLAYRYKSGWGFCEDEIIGISHTLTNISENNAKILLEKAKLQKKSAPVFVIGNGPSLDNDLAFIKANEEHAIIISSGTSLKPLLNYGITPDIHVEQERPKSTYHWVKKIGYEETLKTIPLICLNTVYPGILGLFKKPYVMLKAGDAGTSFIQEYVSNKYLELFYCNPTVTNASTSGAIAMGFENLYLFGLDYGFRSEDEHHAQGSIYQDIEGYKLKGHFKVPASLGGEVYTTRVFDHSRGILEKLLEQNPKVKCTNLSDGALIQLTNAERTESLPKFKKLKDKKSIVERCLNTSFNKSYTIENNLSDEFCSVLPQFKQYIQYLVESLNDVKTKNELTTVFSAQFKFVNQHNEIKSKKLFYRLFAGSLNFLQACIMSNVAQYTEHQAQLNYIQFCIKEMQEHLLFLFDDLKENYNKPARA